MDKSYLSEYQYTQSEIYKLSCDPLFLKQFTVPELISELATLNTQLTTITIWLLS